MSEVTFDFPHMFDNPEDRIHLRIHGINVLAREMEDENGKFLAIPAMNKSFTNICGEIHNGHEIIRTDYETYHGKVAIVKAYY